MIHEIRTGKDGTQYFRAMYWQKEDSHFRKFGEDLQFLASGEVTGKKLRELISIAIPDLVTWMWGDYAHIPDRSFYCKHPYEKYDEEFGLWGLELSDYFEQAQEYFRNFVGIPMWAELSIGNVDLSDANYERPIEDLWGRGEFLHSTGSSLALIYAMQNASEGDLEFNKKLNPIDKFIIQDDPNWYRDQESYYNWLDFDVTVDQKEIERYHSLVGTSYKSMTIEQRKHLVLAAIEAMKIKELEKQKVPQYLLTLLKNHPSTEPDLVSQIVQLKDENIIGIRD